MLDAYASVGLPLMYRHWSFGKRFAYHETLYRKGLQGLAYEIVINSNPVHLLHHGRELHDHADAGHRACRRSATTISSRTTICSGSGPMPTASSIISSFARDYVAKCEEKYGLEAVERVLDAGARAEGPRRQPLCPPLEAQPRRGAPADERAPRPRRGDLQRSVAHRPDRRTRTRTRSRTSDKRHEDMQRKLGLPEENLLYFIEKRAPRLEDWQRELIRIVRHVSQYFYPQKQTQMMNEGCATFCHYEIMNRLHDRGLITEGAMLEFLHSHSSVVFQPGFDDPRYQRAQPLCARLRDDERHQAHLHRPDRGRPRVVPRDRRQRRSLRRAAPRLGQLPRRELHPAVSEPGGHPPVPPVPDRRRQSASRRCGSMRSTTSSAIATSAARCRSNTICRGASPTSRSSMSISPATAAWSWRITSMTACCSRKRPAARCCAIPRCCGATRSSCSRSRRQPTRC